jgi:dimeric dUTPase (all-alpha-NTP-PPase superfamily)
MYPINKDPHDMLRQMFYQQEAFMYQLQEERGFPKFPVDLATKEGQLLIKDIAHNAMDELFESIQILKAAKHHRVSAPTDVDREKYTEELVDCIHYMWEVVIASGISVEELFAAYMKKGEINRERIKENY